MWSLMKHSKFYLSAALAILGIASNASAYNITINDAQSPNAAGWGAPGVGRGGEDEETESHTLANQRWDYEAFTVNAGKLKIYTGFNMLTGEAPYGTGDIFIDINGDANWKPGADNSINGTTDNSVFHYDYVIHFTGRSGTAVTGAYDVYAIADNSNVKFLETKFQSGSNPWILDETSTDIKKVASGNLTLTKNTSFNITIPEGDKLTGGSNFAPHWISNDIDLSFATGINGKTLFHLTQECGNDSLVGQLADGGTTLALMGAAMSGLSFFVRRNRKA